MQATELQKVIASSLLYFPVTLLDAELEFNKSAYQDLISWLSQYDATALFAARRTEGLLSLTPADVTTVVKAAKGQYPNLTTPDRKLPDFDRI